MSILSESLTIGLLLTLVFGALFFYVYSRVSYVEKRVGLIENILIDIQVKQDQQPVQMLPIRPPSITFHNASVQMNDVQPEHIESAPAEQVTEDEYSDILEQAHASVDLSENTIPLDTELSNELPKLSVNYESMSKEELLEVAKKKGIRVSNRPGREKLLQLIRGNEQMNTMLQSVSEE